MTSRPAARRGRDLIDRQHTGPCVLAGSDRFRRRPSVVHAPDGKYRMFHSRRRKRNGFNAWLAMREVVHRAADRPEDPFRFVPPAIADRRQGRGAWCTAQNPEFARFQGRSTFHFVRTRGAFSGAGARR